LYSSKLGKVLLCQPKEAYKIFVKVKLKGKRIPEVSFLCTCTRFTVMSQTQHSVHRGSLLLQVSCAWKRFPYKYLH